MTAPPPRRRRSTAASSSTGRQDRPERSPAPSKAVYEIVVTLADIDPPVWRRLLVPADTTLAAFHHMLQAAMGWEESHLHRFEAGERLYTDPRFGLEQDHEDEDRVALSKLVREGVTAFRYEYDFGDSWEHEVVVEKVHPEDDAPASLPVCVAGARACPPEDVGGFPGYEEFLAAIADPEDEQHEEMLDWIGGAFDPEAFDLRAANRALRRVGRAWGS